jgi:hypothetical protein
MSLEIVPLNLLSLKLIVPDKANGGYWLVIVVEYIAARCHILNYVLRNASVFGT